MFQFFVEKTQIAPQDGRAVITGPDVNHICHVLRMKSGERVYVSDGSGTGKYLCEIMSMSEEQVVCGILETTTESRELPCDITLYQGLPKADKMELIIQKAVELGVSRIVPVSMKRSVVKLDAKKADVKIGRWQGIAEAAAKQSKRDCIPQIGPLMGFREALEEARDFEVRLLPYENARGMDYTRALISSVKPGQRVAVFIGPEGGFEDSEISLAMEKQTHPVTLGPRILRTETAGLAILSMFIYALEP